MKITTNLEWNDLVLDANTASQVEEIRVWIVNKATLEEESHLKRFIKPGYRVFFYGASGTGKKLVAMLLGKAANLPVYNLDLSLIASKYIGETEKNIAAIFEKATKDKAILFFNEADALFGKRTQTSSNNNRHANQEIAYILQCIEDFNGLVILASNSKYNLDEAFARRFQAMVHFPMPNSNERLKLWNTIFSNTYKLNDTISVVNIAERYELSGGNIVNILQQVSILKEKEKAQEISKAMVMQAIRDEFIKKGKSILVN